MKNPFIVIYPTGKIMGHNPINRVYASLRALDVVSSQAEFCKDWLGRSESYLRGLRFHQAEPAVSVVALCASRLQHYGEQLAVKGTHPRGAALLLELSDECNHWIFEHSRRQWLPQKGFVAQNPMAAV